MMCLFQKNDDLNSKTNIRVDRPETQVFPQTTSACVERMDKKSDAENVTKVGSVAVQVIVGPTLVIVH